MSQEITAPLLDLWEFGSRKAYQDPDQRPGFLDLGLILTLKVQDLFRSED